MDKSAEKTIDSCLDEINYCREKIEKCKSMQRFCIGGMIASLIVIVLILFSPPVKPEPKLYTNYNPLHEVSQERIDNWKEVAYKNAKEAQEAREKIATLRARRAEEQARRDSATFSSTQVSRASSRTTQKTTYSVERWRYLVEKYFPANQVENALLVMQGESGGNPNAVSHTSDYGLFQINAPTWCKFFGVTREQLKDPELNVKLARVIYDRAGGWAPWVYARKIGL